MTTLIRSRHAGRDGAPGARDGWRSRPSSCSAPRCPRPAPPHTGRTRRSAAVRSARTRSCASAGAPARNPAPRSRRPSRRPPRTSPRAGPRSAATFAYDAGGSNPIGYGAGATCGVNGLACFTRDAPDGFTMWLREQGHVFDWGTLKWCQAYTTAPNGCYDAETIALDEFGHVEGLDHHVNYADDSRLRRRRRPDVLADEAGGRLEPPRVRPMRRGDPPAPVRRDHLDREVLDLPRPGDRPDAERVAGVDPGRRHDDVDRDAEGRRPRRRYGRLAGNPVAGRTRDPPAPSTRRDGLGRPSARCRPAPAQGPTSSPSGPARHRIPSGLHDADRTRASTATRRRPSASMSSSRAARSPAPTPSSPIPCA